MRIVNSATDDVAALLKKRGIARDSETERVVAEIIADVRKRGDAALLHNVQRFDAPNLRQFHMSMTERDSGIKELTKEQWDALGAAYVKIFSFHTTQWELLRFRLDPPPPMQAPPGGSLRGKIDYYDAADAWSWTCPFDGKSPNTGQYGQRYIPLESVAIYIPGGNAAYPSTVFMNAAPAYCAGVRKIFVATPARRDGTVHPAVRHAIKKSETVGAIKVGGAAAIAAYALGSDTVPRVDKIVGPGNRYVTEAKRQLWGEVGFDGLAGPSEVCVLADDAANAAYAAADLLTQVEHAPDNAGFLITLSEAKMKAVLAEVERQLQGAPRAATMREALANESLGIIARDASEAIDFVNLIAPEHLSLAVADPDPYLLYIRNAGCILIGDFTPESAADYCIGPSHVLPTGRAARWQGALNVLDFIKVQSIARLSESDLTPLIPVIEAIGDLKGFPAHARGASIRRRGL